MTEHPTLAAALVAALPQLTVVEKNRQVDMELKSGRRIKYDYADLADVVKMTRPVLAEHGIIALSPVHDHGGGLACTVILMHASGDRIDLGPFPFPHGADAQATGSMVTYHRRYSLLAALGMAAGDDDDDGAEATTKQRAVRAEQESPYISADNVEALKLRCEEHKVKVADVVSRATGDRTKDPAKVYKTEVAAVKKAMEELTKQPEPVA